MPLLASGGSRRTNVQACALPEASNCRDVSNDFLEMKKPGLFHCSGPVRQNALCRTGLDVNKLKCGAVSIMGDYYNVGSGVSPYVALEQFGVGNSTSTVWSPSFFSPMVVAPPHGRSRLEVQNRG